MAPPREGVPHDTPPIPGPGIEEELWEAQQAGRTPSALHAERAAAALRDTVSRTQSNPDNPPNKLQKKASKESSTNPSLASGSSISRPHTSYQRPVSYSPPVPSPLKPTTSSGSDESKADTDGTRGSGDGIKPSPRLQRPLEDSPGQRPPRPPVRVLKQKSTPDIVESSFTRIGTPMTVSELGSDYTRYFNPFTDSPRSSFVEPSTNYSAPSNAAGGAAASNLTNPFNTPNVSTTKLNVVADPEKQGYLVDDRLGAPYDEKGGWSWPLVGDDAEDDDEMHMPRDDDDIKYKARFSDHFSRENIASTIGLIFMILGLLFVFIALPILSYSGVIDYSSMYATPLDQMTRLFPEAETWAVVNNRTYPLLNNIRRGLIDPDTPAKAKTKTGVNGDEYVLVFSDEFNQNNRTFYEGDDPYWFAPDIWYGATKDLDWYDPDAATTWDGTLELRLDKFINHGLNYRSGMLNSWNQLCFKGGIFEVSVSLPGPAAIRGLWPGAWTMGNLGRPGYLSTTEGLWPYTYNSCDVGITPNQSSYDGTSGLPGQRLNACTCPGEDHPTPGTGRGAPEIDIFEAGASWGGLPIATQSYQVAPFDIFYYPDYEFFSFPDYSTSWVNGYTGGMYQQAISATTNLNRNWYDGKQYQKYAFEYTPGEGEGAYIAWTVGDQVTAYLDGRAIGPNGNIAARQISEEPMSMVLNLGISNSWTVIDFPNLVFPTVMRVDYVRWYQKAGSESVTCDPPGYETTKYIKEHLNAYTNPNFTHWSQTGHPWPKHKLNTAC